MFSLIASLLTTVHAETAADRVAAAIAYGRAKRAVAARCDVGTRANGKTWAERINRAVFAGTSRVTFASPEIEAARMLRERAIRCDVYAENHGFTGRASFGGAA